MLAPKRFAWIVLTVLGGLALCYITGIPLVLEFLCGLVLLIYFTARMGIEMKSIVQSMRNGAGHTKEVIWILLLVGVMIPAWTASGTIPYMINIGLSYLSPGFFLTSAFVFSAVISMTLGTSTGTLSTIGIPMIGVAVYLEVPLPLAAGALVSGAFVGDRTSPFSSAYQLVASSTGVTLKNLARAVLPTTIAAVLIALAVYAFIDFTAAWGDNMDTYQKDPFGTAFRYHPVLLVPPLLLVGSILLRTKTKVAFAASIAASLVIGTYMQQVNFPDWGSLLWSGFEHHELAKLHTKGLSNMIPLVLLIASAGAFNGILEEHRIIQPYTRRILGSSRSLFVSTIKVVLFGLGLGLISCTQTLPIMMSGRNLLPIWIERHRKEQLGRIVADSSLILAAMVPWNMLAILCSTIIGVAVEDYVPYALFLWLLPLLTLGWSWIKQQQRSVPQEG